MKPRVDGGVHVAHSKHDQKHLTTTAKELTRATSYIYMRLLESVARTFLTLVPTILYV